MPRVTNHVNVYQIVFRDPDNMNFELLKAKLQEFLDANEPMQTQNGTYYIKDMRELDGNLVCLFGKDNFDASNQKREIDSLNFSNIDLNRETEVLTDFIHIAIGDEFSREGGSRVHTFLAEKSSLVNVYNIKNFLINLTGDSFSMEIRKQITSEFYSAVRDARRIIEIVHSVEVEPPLLPGNQNIENENIIAKQQLVLKAAPRRSLPFLNFDSVYNDRYNSQDPSQKLYVTIQDQSGSVFDIDFSKSEVTFSERYDIPVNRKENGIQEDIAERMSQVISIV